MTQEQKEFQQNITFKARQKGWFISFLISKVLPFIIENWDELFPKKDKVQAFSGCQSPKPKNQLTPNGSWECIGGQWVWVDDLG